MASIRTNIAASAALLGLLAAPIAAQTAPVTRAAAPVEGESALNTNSAVFFAGIAAIALAVVFLSENDDPVSP